MSLNGDLEHFPIIDVIQLLHGSRKTGVFRLYCDKGESQLVFHDGDLVSANFLNNRVRIGQVLVSSGAITEQQLSEALDIQAKAGDERKPLVITMLEHNMVDETAAYNCIESLIEMTIVEVLTWKEGRFSLDIAKGNSTNGYHFSRTKFPQRILLNSQGILMESLRIFDEKMRDGTMDEILSIAGISNLDLDNEQPGSAGQVITADAHDQSGSPSLLQKLLAEKRNMIQRSCDQSYRSEQALKKLIVHEFPAADKAKKRQMLALLAGSIPARSLEASPPEVAVIVITSSELVSTIVRSVCFQEGVYAVSSDNIESLDVNIRLLLCQTLHLVIILDIPHDFVCQDIIQLCSDLQKYPQATVVLAACPRYWINCGLQATSAGVRSIIPKPCKECSGDAYMQQSLSFCSDLGTFIHSLALDYKSSDEQRFFNCISRLRSSKTRTEITDAVLEYLIEVFERAIVFSVRGSELVAEESFGIKADKSEGIMSLSGLSIPLDDQPIFEDVIQTGRMYYGFHSDSTLPHQLYRLIGRLDSPEVLIFPMIRANSVVAFIYADFGTRHASSPSLHYLEALLQYTTAQISVSAYRQKLRSLLEQQKTANPSG